MQRKMKISTRRITKKLFEYKLKSKNKSEVQTTSSSEEEDDRIGEDGMQESIYKKRKFYT